MSGLPARWLPYSLVQAACRQPFYLHLIPGVGSRGCSGGQDPTPFWGTPNFIKMRENDFMYALMCYILVLSSSLDALPLSRLLDPFLYISYNCSKGEGIGLARSIPSPFKPIKVARMSDYSPQRVNSGKSSLMMTSHA